MWFVIGLGNPGVQYANSRHNIGFMAIDRLAQRFPVSQALSNTWSQLRQSTFQTHSVFLVQPQTYMNRSGLAVQELIDQYPQAREHLIVLYDDLDLALGILRIRPRGGHGGHKGIKSILEHLGDDQFIRVRIGIGRPQHETVHEASSAREDIVDYVLHPFNKEELPIIDNVLNRAADALELILSGQLDAAMNQFNRRDIQSSASIVT